MKLRLTGRLSELEREHDAGFADPKWGRAYRECPPVTIKGDVVDMTPTLRRYAKLAAVDMLEAAQELKRYIEEGRLGEISGDWGGSE